jgi:hypothetical protein
MTTISMVAKSVWHPRNARMAIATHGALHPAGPFFLLLLFYVLGFEMLFPDQVKTLFINAIVPAHNTTQFSRSKKHNQKQISKIRSN